MFYTHTRPQRHTNTLTRAYAKRQYTQTPWIKYSLQCTQRTASTIPKTTSYVHMYINSCIESLSHRRIVGCLHDVWAWYLTWKICVLFTWTLDSRQWNSGTDNNEGGGGSCGGGGDGDDHDDGIRPLIRERKSERKKIGERCEELTLCTVFLSLALYGTRRYCYYIIVL